MFVFCFTGCDEKWIKEYKMFFDQPLSKQHEIFRTLPIERQFDLYVYALTERHPPDLSFADDIAVGGEKNIPFVMDKLKNAENDSVQQKIIYIFERMAKNNIQVDKNKELLDLISKSISSMKIPLYIERSKKSLSIITEEK